MPKEMNYILRLRAFLQDSSRGALMRRIILDNIEENNFTVENLTERCASHLYHQWYSRYSETVPFETYLKESRTNLMEQNLPENLITIIITECEEQKNRQ